MKKFEYVISGTSYTTLTKAVLEQFQQGDEISNMAHRLNAACDDHKVSILFNGLTEKNLAEPLNKIFKDSVNYYVDSGGLQMVTLGLESTPEKKREVYGVQAKWGTYGMSFDEIPVKLLGNKSSFFDVKGRVFDPETFDACAKLSGENLRDQIDFYIEYGTTAKPFLIVQGNDLHYYQRWIDIMLGCIDPEKWKYIGGLSIGAAALGQGELEDFKRAFYATQLQAPDNVKNHVHLLGVGALRRMCPWISLINGGHFKDTMISYDSTTHTRALQEATYHKDFVLQKFLYGRLIPFYKTVIPDIIDVSKNVLGVDVKEEYIVDAYLAKRSKYVAENGNDNDYNLSLAKYCALFSSVYNFTRDVEALSNDFTNFMKIDPSGYQVYDSFKQVRDQNDFSTWVHYHQNMIGSKGVQSAAKISTLEALFAE